MVRKNKDDDTPRKRPRKLKSDVHAQHAIWTYVLDNDTGQVTQYIGRFEDVVHAAGAAKHLFNARILKKQIPSGEDLREGDIYVIRLERKYGDNLRAFEAFARGHGLPKDMKPERQTQPPTYERRHRVSPMPRPLHRPLAEKIACAMIERLPWQEVEVAGVTSVICSTDDPVVAFQVANRMKQDGFINDTAYLRLIQDIAACERSGVSNEFRICIDPNKLPAFNHKFPKAGTGLGALDQNWVDRVHDLSHFPDSPRKPR